jgi:hypothetical protein
MKVPHPSSKTGLSTDYINEYWGLSIYADRGHRDELIGAIRERPRLHYDERYNPKKFDYDTKNPNIAELNQIADIVNHKARDGTLQCKEFLKFAEKVESIIKGD